LNLSKGIFGLRYRILVDGEKVDLDEIGKLHQKAAEITALAHKEVMKMIEPGLKEQDLKEKIDEIFNDNGAPHLAFSHIVGSGPNSTEIHYSGNARTNYSRPIPVGKIFTIEPGLYIPNEEIGVRIEDDYVMTEEGAVNIWNELISDPDAVEEFISQSERAF